MKIEFILDTPLAWQSGIWYHRNEMPGNALKKRGHGVKQVAIGKEMPEEFLEYPDTVIFGRTYPQAFDPVQLMKEFKKRGKRVLYDMDDDFWNVSKDNPSSLVSNAFKDQYESLIKEADAIITPSKILAKKFKKLAKKPVFICPNGIDPNIYKEGPRVADKLVIGFAGAASHWKDLSMIAEVMEKLSEKYDFYFSIYGMIGESIEAAMFFYKKMLDTGFQPEKNEYFRSALEFYSQLKNVKLLHVPFHPPEIYPAILGRCDFDIGIAPLEDNEFNRGKSCLKFYEYASVGAVTLASDVEPYKSEVNYRAKNTVKDWYKKLEKLIVDAEFRKKLLKEQQDYVFNNRTWKDVSLDWEMACQKPGGLKVSNQQK